MYKQEIDQSANLSYVYEKNLQPSKNISSLSDCLMSSCFDSVNWDIMVKKYAKKRLTT